MVKVLVFNKYRDTPDAFEKRARSALEATPLRLVDFSMAEHGHTGHIIFLFQFVGPRSGTQDFCLLGWTPLDRVEALVNATLEGIASNQMTARNINIVATAKSERALAAMIVEQAEAGSASEDKQPKDQQAETVRSEEQNSKPATEPKPKRERKSRARNRALDDG